MAKKFSEFSYTAVYDMDLNIIWSDNKLLFSQMSAGGKKLLKIIKNSNPLISVYHTFKFRGIYYRAKLDRLPNDTLMCRAAEELPSDLPDENDLMRYFDGINHSGLNIHSMVKMIEHYVRNTQYVSDEFHEYLTIQKLESESIISDCHNVIHAFDNKYNAEFLPLMKYIERSVDIVRYVTRNSGKNFKIKTDLIFPYVKIDYSKFELALFNLIKIVLIYYKGNIEPCISIKTPNFNEIEIKTEFQLNSGYELSNCGLEIKAIKHIFRKMGGSFQLYIDEDTVYAQGSFNAEFSQDDSSVPQGRDLIYVGSEDIDERREKANRYIRIYENEKKDDGMYLASGIEEFTDRADPDISFAEIFFSKIILSQS